MRLGWMWTGALAATVGLLLVSGCSAGPADDLPRSGASGATSYWNSSRLMGARPLSAGLHRAPLTGEMPQAHTALSPLAVGALFEPDESGTHFFTGSAVAIPSEELLITAAH